MAKVAHRIAFNCDLFMTITTDSAETTLEELERLVIARINPAAKETASIGFDIPDLEDVGARIYPRVVTTAESLENLTIENVEEVTA